MEEGSEGAPRGRAGCRTNPRVQERCEAGITAPKWEQGKRDGEKNVSGKAAERSQRIRENQGLASQCPVPREEGCLARCPLIQHIRSWMALCVQEACGLARL